MQIHLEDVEIFHWINENFDQLVGSGEKKCDHQSSWDSSTGYHGYMHQITWQTI